MSETQPGWIKDVENAEEYGQPTFALATLSADGKRPEVRHIVLREHHLLPNSTPNTPPLALLLFTTDLRTPKVNQLSTHPESSLTSWIAEENLQLRFSCTGHVYTGPTSSSSTLETNNDWLNPSAAGEAGLRDLGEGEGFDWEEKRRELFEADELTDRIRAWHAKGPPGGRLDSVVERERKDWPMELAVEDEDTSEEDKEALDKAYSNFGLLVFKPYEVDVVRMVSEGVDKRLQWNLQEDGRWTSVELIP